ncbi:hypothetical protein B1810_22060 [Panacagrimonas perspica]|nr:hypothetical protein B1810_22060 [Panacagrimonas perspica]
MQESRDSSGKSKQAQIPHTRIKPDSYANLFDLSYEKLATLDQGNFGAFSSIDDPRVISVHYRIEVGLDIDRALCRVFRIAEIETEVGLE